MSLISSKPKKKSILLIDNEVDLLMLMRSFFLRRNYDVIMANTLEEGLDIIRKDILDFVVISEDQYSDFQEVEEKIHSVAPNIRIIKNASDLKSL